MGARLSVPARVTPLSDLISDLTSECIPIAASNRRHPRRHANVILAWRFVQDRIAEPIDLRELEAFQSDESVVVLRLFDGAALYHCLTVTMPPQGKPERLCASAWAMINRDHLTVPLNVTKHTVDLAQGTVQLSYRVFVWSGNHATPANRSVAESRGFEIAFALSSATLSGIAALERIWFDTDMIEPFPSESSASDSATANMNSIIVYRICCSTGDEIDKPPPLEMKMTAEDPAGNSIGTRKLLNTNSLRLNLTSVSRESPATSSQTQRSAAPTRKMSSHGDAPSIISNLIHPRMSEEQQKITLMGHYEMQSSAIDASLFLSGEAVASCLPHLVSRGVTHIVNAAADVCADFFPDKFEYLSLKLNDAKTEDIMCRIYDVIEFIDHALLDPNSIVLVHCHRGVSRSATFVIAYLMYKYDLTFQHAFDRVKAARDIINPNIGFQVTLITWYTRLHPLPSTIDTVAYRIAPFNTRDPLTTVAKIVNVNNPIDSRGVYVFHAEHAIFIWIGQQSNRRFLVFAQRTLVDRLHRYEHAPTRVIEVAEHKEPAEFLELFALSRQEKFSSGSLADYDTDYTIVMKAGQPRAVDQYGSGSMSHRPPATARTPSLTTARQTGGSTRRPLQSLGDDEDGEAHMKLGEQAEARLFRLPGWHEVEAFGAEDLSIDAAFVCVATAVDGTAAHVHVWIGDKFSPNSPVDEFVARVGKDCMARLKLPERRTAVIRQDPSMESDEFWDMF